LFELYVPEIEDGTIEIKSIVREAGYRAKVAVHCDNSDVDPVSACIGARGVRIQYIVAELMNEKIDVIRYSSNPVEYISNALSPARITTVALYEGSAEKGVRHATVVVPNDQLDLAIGAEGRNVRLATKLTDWKITIEPESQAQDKPNK
jgi:transcription termination/antitermination protein NusA